MNVRDVSELQMHIRHRAQGSRSHGAGVFGDDAVAAAGEAAVGDEGDLFAQAFAHDGGGGGEHFSHAGSAARAFEADDDDVAFDDGAVEDFLEGGFFGVEDAGAA